MSLSSVPLLPRRRIADITYDRFDLVDLKTICRFIILSSGKQLSILPKHTFTAFSSPLPRVSKNFRIQILSKLNIPDNLIRFGSSSFFQGKQKYP